MKAIRFHENGGPEVLRFEDVPVPQVKPNQVLIRIAASGVNYADIIRRAGQYYPVKDVLPAIAGSEMIGVIEQVGADIQLLRVGDRVLGATPAGGGYAEYCAVDEEFTYRFPANVGDNEGLALSVQGLSAAAILRQGRFTADDAVLVEAAAGGVGILAVQLAKIWGSRMVIGAAGSPAKRRLVEDHGADATVDYGVPDWSEEVLRLTGGSGVNLVLEMTGGDVLQQALRALAISGRMVVYGLASGAPDVLHYARLMPRAHSVIGFYLGLYLADRPYIEGSLRQMADYVEQGRLKIPPVHTLKLAEAADAHRMLEGRSTTGKLVLIP